MPTQAKLQATHAAKALAEKLGTKHWKPLVIERMFDSWEWGAELRVGHGFEAVIKPVPLTNATRYGLNLYGGAQRVTLEADEPAQLFEMALAQLRDQVAALNVQCVAMEKITGAGSRSTTPMLAA